MQFSRLRLAGFKSFVEPTEILIEAGLTGIVGPNGCGKSNLVEALRWAMGEASAKGLRGGEMDDVIFAGTRGRPAYDLAEVTLQMRTDGLQLAALGEVDEIELVRRIARGAGSAYRVNGRDVRARDVQLLFADAASGAKSASIVSQGQIGALVEAKPGDRRRLLEDAAGVAGLQARRHEAELKLQATEANLARALDLIGELEEQCARLKKQARQAKRYRELSAACRDAQAALLSARFVVARAHRDRLAGTLEGEEQAVRSASARAKQAREAREQTAAALDLARTAVADAGAEQARLSERLRAAQREAALEVEKRADLETRAASAARDLAAAEREVEDASRALERLSNEQQELARASAEDEAALAHHQQEFEDAGLAATKAEERLRVQLSQATTVRTDLAHQRTLCAQAEARRGELEAEAARLAEALGRVPEPEPESEEALVREAEAALARALEEAEGAADRAARADQTVEAASAALAEAERTLADEKARLQTLQAERERAELARQRCAERLFELEQRLERLVGREQRLHGRRGDREHALAALGLERLGADAAAAEVDAARLKEGRDEAARQLADARADESEIAGQAGQVRELIQTLRAELRALEEVAPAEASFAPVLDQVEVEEGFAEALAAALGEDLLASLEAGAPCRWVADGPAVGPALPEGSVPLARYVQAPAALLSRLGQIGVVTDAASAELLRPTLAQGQRLVSRDGGLWRWDGFSRRAEVASQAAARVRQAHRRQELVRELAEARHGLEQLEARLAEAEREVASRREADQRLSAAVDQAQRTLDGCVRAHAEGEVAAGSLRSELEALHQEAEALDGERADVADERERVRIDLDEMNVPSTVGSEGEDALPQLSARRDDSAQEHSEALRTRSTSRAKAEAARRAVSEAQRALERAREQDRAAREARQAEVQERARLESERARCADLLETAAASEASAREAMDRLDPELAAADAALEEAEQAAAEARRHFAEAESAAARLEDRRETMAARRAAVMSEITDWTERAHGRRAWLDELRARQVALEAELAAIADQPDRVDADERLRLALAEAERCLAETGEARTKAEADMAEAEAELAEAARVTGTGREAIARHEAEFEAASSTLEAAARALVERELAGPPADSPVPSDNELEQLEAQLAKAEVARERLGPVNLRAVDEAAEAEMRLEVLTHERDELLAAIERLRRAIASLNREGRDRLRQAFAAVEQHFEALFVRLFGGGEARLALTDMEDPLAAGLELMASPPGKKLQSVSLLSGGEKALTALALVFAVFLTRPSPLCVLDEVDAPLDDANVERLGALLEELAASTETRFLVITHHPLTMARMDRLYGVTMLERGVSRLVSVDLRAAEELRATA